MRNFPQASYLLVNELIPVRPLTDFSQIDWHSESQAKLECKIVVVGNLIQSGRISIFHVNVLAVIRNLRLDNWIHKATQHHVTYKYMHKTER